MASRRFRLLARKGWLILAGVAAVGAVPAYLLGRWVTAPVVLAAAAVVVIFRDPVREIPGRALAVVSPADGVVEDLREAYDPYLDREAWRIGLVPRLWGAYSLRSPVEGKVQELPAPSRKSPHTGALYLETDEGEEVVVIIQAGVLRWRSPYRVPIGERVGQGQRCGSTRLIRRLELYLPVTARPRVRTGERVEAGTGLLALLTRRL